MEENPLKSSAPFIPRFHSIAFLTWMIAGIGIVAVFACIIGAFYVGRKSVQLENAVKNTPTVSIVPTIAPTDAPNPTNCQPPPCSDVVPANCTRSAPVYNASGCLISCGQLQCK